MGIKGLPDIVWQLSVIAFSLFLTVTHLSLDSFDEPLFLFIYLFFVSIVKYFKS